MSSSGRTRKTVLCIGNDPVSLNLRCSLLREQGWTVVGSGDGNEGAILFRSHPTGAAVLDLNDEGVQSALIAGELKRTSPGVRIVILEVDGKPLADGVRECADAVVRKSDALGLVKVLEGWFKGN